MTPGERLAKRYEDRKVEKEARRMNWPGVKYVAPEDRPVPYRKPKEEGSSND